jgi:hypothetical protein
MPSIHPRDRATLCRFSFSDGRRCRSPRVSTSPDFCYYHAEKAAHAAASEQLAADLSILFSGRLISANDLSAALSRLLTAVILGHIKPRTARTVAYMAQTLSQTLRVAQDEYINSYGSDAWRRAIHSNITSNHPRISNPPRLNQPAPNSAPPSTPPPAKTSTRSASVQPRNSSSAPQPSQAAQPSDSRRPPANSADAALAVASQLFPPRPSQPSPNAAASALPRPHTNPSPEPPPQRT